MALIWFHLRRCQVRVAAGRRVLAQTDLATSTGGCFIEFQHCDGLLLHPVFASALQRTDNGVVELVRVDMQRMLLFPAGSDWAFLPAAYGLPTRHVNLTMNSVRIESECSTVQDYGAWVAALADSPQPRVSSCMRHACNRSSLSFFWQQGCAQQGGSQHEMDVPRGQAGQGVWRTVHVVHGRHSCMCSAGRAPSTHAQLQSW